MSNRLTTLFNYARRDVEAFRHVILLNMWQHPFYSVVAIVAVITFTIWAASPLGSNFVNQPLWDWLDLLLIPAVLGVSVFLFNLALQRRQTQLAKEERETDREIARQENETDREIGREQSREETHRLYLDTMQRLVLENGLRHGADTEVRTIARARTLAVIRTLQGSPDRINHVVEFLKESHLLDTIDYGKPIESPAVTLARADFTGIDLQNVNLNKVNLRSCKFVSANLEATRLTDTCLEEADLLNVNLRHADLTDAHLEGASMRCANLRQALLRGTHLEGTDLYRAHLEGADLFISNLEGAYLISAYIDEADLSGANMSGARLSSAKMRAAKNLTQAQLDSAFRDASTEIPDYLK